MLTLYLDGQPTDLLPTQKVKIMTKAARAGKATTSFTFEITLPLIGSANNQALLPLAQYATRHKRAWKDKRWRAHLLSEGHTIMRGVATLTKLTQEAASVQILGGGAIYSHTMAGADKLYIDELPLGWAYDEQGGGDWRKQSPTAEPSVETFLNNCLNDDDWNALLYGDSDHSPAVFFPTQNEDDTQRANPMALFAVEDGQGGVYMRWSFCIAYRDGMVPISTLGAPKPLWAVYHENGVEYLEQRPAVQPYLAFIVERILGAIGMELRPEDNGLRKMIGLKNLFIVNGRHTLKYAEALPHWTVKEFFDHLQTLLGVTLFVDVEGRVRLEGAHTGEDIRLEQVVDGYSCDYSKGEGEQDERTLATHYGTTWGVPEQNINADLYAVANKEVLTGTPVAEEEGALRTIYFAVNEEHTVATCRRYAFVRRDDAYQLEEVDVLGAKVDDTFRRMTHTPANIAPVRINYTHQGRLQGDNAKGYNERYARVWVLKRGRKNFQIDRIPKLGHKITYHNDTIEAYGPEVRWAVLVTRMQVGPSRRIYDIDLSTLLTQATPEMPRDSPHDTLTLAINACGNSAPHTDLHLNTVEDCKNFAWRKSDKAFEHWRLCGVNPEWPQLARPFSLYHIPTPQEVRADGATSIGYLHQQHTKVSERVGGVEYSYSFVADTLPNPDQNFLIKGRRYGCFALEATYTHEGLEMPIEGKFYELIEPEDTPSTSTSATAYGPSPRPLV